MREAIQIRFFDDHTYPVTWPIFLPVILLFWFVINPVMIGTGFAQEGGKTSHVLFINSYNPGYSWSDDIENGLLESFNLSGKNIEMSVEYLDSRRFPKHLIQNKQADVIFSKYAGFHLDLVIVSDNAAFNFAIRNRERLFPGIPIVFCGYNSFRPDVLRGLTNITGVNEEIDIKGLIETALHIQPNIRTLAFILSTGDVSSKLNDEEIEASIIPQYLDQYKIVLLKDAPMAKIRETLARLPRESALFLLGQTSDMGEGRPLTPIENGRLISAASPVPVYTFWKFHLDTGVLGGRILSGYDQGKEAGEIALQILNGKKADSIDVLMTSPTRNIFDYKVMKRFNIATKALPDDSIVINKPYSFYEANKKIVWITLLAFTTLIALIAVLTMNIFRRMSAERELQRHRDHLEELVKEKTADLTDSIKALADSEAKFRGFSDAAFEGIVFTEKGIITEANNRYCEMFGYHPSEVIGRAATDLASPEERENVKSKILSGYEQPYVVTSLRKDGTTFPCKVQGRMLNYQGRSIRATTLWDITERMQVEMALRESNTRFRNLTEVISDWIWEVDKDGCYTYVSPKVSDILGYNPEELLGKTPFSLMPPEEADRVFNIFKNIVASQKPFDCLENINLHKKGHAVVLETSGTPVFGADGEFIGYRGIDRDITTRKQIEDHLDRERERLSTILDGSPISIFMIDQDYRIVFWNRAFENLSLIPREQALGKTLSESLAPVYPKKTPKILADLVLKMTDEDLLNTYGHKIRKGGFGESFEGATSIWPAGRKRVLDIIATRIRDHQGNILGAIQCAQDVTEKKRLEDQLLHSQKMESIGTLAGGIAHDFNNILGIILGNAELALDDILESNPSRFNLKEIRTASLRAKDVVSQLLSFARKTMLEKKPTNIIPIVEESLKLLRSSIPKSTEIRQNIPEDVYTILADPTQIHQILINLFTNADHSIKNEGVIEITLKNVELGENATAQYPDLSPGRYVNLIVSDNGHGISKEEIDRIFDPYYSTKEVGKGTGMGLAVVHGIVQGHKGIITVESELGKGTTFSILFPAIRTKAVLETKIDEQLPTGDERILLIDDEESMATLGRLRLARLGYKVEATISPIDALEIFRSRPDQFDLVITDLTMPKMTGDKLIEEILKIRSDIPVILCTGFSEKVDEKKAKRIGAAAYIEKPLDKHDFAVIVRKVLDENQ